MPRPDLASLELLVAVADRGGIGAAARSLGVSQPSASARLRALERQLGLALVRRTTHGSILTGEGAAVVGWARVTLGAVQELVDGAAALRGERRRRLRVGASLTVAEHLVPVWVGTLTAREPDVSVTLEVGNSIAVARSVRSGTVQLGFVEGSRAPAGLRSRAIRKDELLLVVAPTHPWAQRGVTPTELAGTPLVMREQGSGTREVLVRWLAGLGLAPTVAMELASTTAVVHAVGAGVAPAVVSRLVVARDIAEHRLVRVPIRTPAGEAVTLARNIRAVWAGPDVPSGAAGSFLRVAAARPSEPAAGR
ncbi:LysR family transcriptional regulator [Georgenia satyanarayanai]|uniref:LysR family transcriptional regulator n=1 Tax=Georgenia satyanarayanai TaxID=860221 RepID=UPI00203B2AEC|nr:LysR family transcriptional regulator [Georgenia satyanarayanai]MCM3659740.1 LysR family transcriptional regulator [Georgenia satyanarayanai]